MNLDSAYYPEEYTAELSIYCTDCDIEFDKEVDVKGNYYETKCPKCEETISRYVR